MCFENTIFTEPVVVSILGGILYQIYPFIEHSKLRKKTPRFNKDRYIAIVLQMFCSGLIGYVYFHRDAEIPLIIPLHIGISSPLIIKLLGGRE